MKTFRTIVFGVAILNFLAFIIGAAKLGGSAAETEGGRYYVSEHGKRAEVSRTAYTYSRVHGYSVICTHVAAMIVAALTSDFRVRRRGV